MCIQTNNKIKILIAEDHPLIREMLSRQIEIMGHEYTCACDGLEAVAAATTSFFDIILMDIQMPNMDGLSAARRIRERENVTSSSRSAIIAITAHEAKENCLQAGMDDHIDKVDLFAKLAEMLERWKLQCSACVAP